MQLFAIKKNIIFLQLSCLQATKISQYHSTLLCSYNIVTKDNSTIMHQEVILQRCVEN